MSRQAQRFRKVRYRYRGRRSTFARYGAEFDAGAALNQRGGWGPHDVRGSEDSTRGALSSVSILQISRGFGGGGGRPPMMFEEVMIQQRVVRIEEVMIQQRVR